MNHQLNLPAFCCAFFSSDGWPNKTYTSLSIKYDSGNIRGRWLTFHLPCYLWYLGNINCFILQKYDLLRHPPRYQPNWTIYIPFEGPWLIDFRNARFDLYFCCYAIPYGTTLCKLVFSVGIAAWEQRHTTKTIRLEIFPNLLFFNLLVNYLLHAAPSVIYRWRNVLEKI